MVDEGHGFIFCEVLPLLHKKVYGLVPLAPLDVTVPQVPGHTVLPVATTTGPVQLITFIVSLY